MLLTNFFLSSFANINSGLVPEALFDFIVFVTTPEDGFGDMPTGTDT